MWTSADFCSCNISFSFCRIGCKIGWQKWKDSWTMRWRRNLPNLISRTVSSSSILYLEATMCCFGSFTCTRFLGFRVHGHWWKKLISEIVFNFRQSNLSGDFRISVFMWGDDWHSQPGTEDVWKGTTFRYKQEGRVPPQHRQPCEPVRLGSYAGLVALISFLSGFFSLFTPAVCSSHLFKPCSAIAGMFFLLNKASSFLLVWVLVITFFFNGLGFNPKP